MLKPGDAMGEKLLYRTHLSTTPANTATARFVNTVTHVTSARTIASVRGIFVTREKLVQSKMSKTRHSIFPASAAIGTLSMNPYPNVTYARIASAHVTPLTRVRPPL